jgi:hypothetical protein
VLMLAASAASAPQFASRIVAPGHNNAGQKAGLALPFLRHL